MKSDLHPTYAEATIVCSCGHTVTTRSTKSDLHVEICSNCHPFYTGKQKFIDTGGRLGRFQARLDAAGGETAAGGKKKGASVRTFTPAVDPKVMKAKADRAAAKAVEDAKRRKEAEEAAKAEAAEAKAAKAEAAKAEAAEKRTQADAAAASAGEDAPAGSAAELADTEGGGDAAAAGEPDAPSADATSATEEA